MCAKVAQNHETKEQKAKNPSKVLLSRIFYVPLPRQRTIETGWWLSVWSSSRSEATKGRAYAHAGGEHRCLKPFDKGLA